ncbi:hypothetical protein ACIQF8_15030 [Pseudarthrobacter sp. NPDC092184]
MDYGTQTRIPKQSAYWYRDTIATRNGGALRPAAAPLTAGATA